MPRREAETILLRQHIAPQILGGTSVGNINPDMIRQLRIKALEPKSNETVSIQPHQHDEFIQSHTPD